MCINVLAYLRPNARFVQMEAIVEPGNEVYVHHMLFYECHTNGSSDAVYGQYVGKESYGCYTPEMPEVYYDCLTHYAFTWVNIALNFIA